jgi:7-cyano-7-deazaguanine reductase
MTKENYLSILGHKVAPAYNNPHYSMIECFPNPATKDYSITFITEEFTSLCPVTGGPDFGKIEISYTPDKLCIESKSLKLYLGAYRLYQGFMEEMTNKILNDLVKACNPTFMTVIGEWKSRGGIVTRVCSNYYKSEGCVNLSKICGRCYDEVEEVFPANCQEKPELIKGPIGQYHCPDCGAMVMAGFSHPYLCKICIDRKHPEFDDK